MMDTVEGYLNNITVAATNDGTAYLLLSDNMINIVANNTTLTNTVATMQKENSILRDKIDSLKNKLVAETGKAVPVTTKNYTIPWPVTGSPKKWMKGGYCWAHGCGVGPDHDSSTCGSQNKNLWKKFKATCSDIMGRCTDNKGWYD